MTKPPKIQAGQKGLRAHVKDAFRALEQADSKIDDPAPSEARNGIKPGQWPGAPWDNMPPDCPFEVLGENQGTIYIRTATHGLMEVTNIDHQAVMRMCAPFPNYPLWAWPGFGKPETDEATGETILKVKRLERDRAATCIITEAAKRGTFDIQRSVRGRGGWRAGERFVWHGGERLWTVDSDIRDGHAVQWDLKNSPPAQLHGMFYAKGPDTIVPWTEPVASIESPAHQILQDLTTWNWQRPWLDPLLVLGWIGIGWLGGAVKKRPILAVTGGRGRGKSTLVDYIEAIYGPIIYSTKDTTAAGIYQNMRQDSRPVIVDEFEARANSLKEKAIVELARHSYDGSNINRGSSDHEGIQFQMYSAFMVAGINLPPFEQQDRSRMAMLGLNPLTHSGAEPVVKDIWGRMLLRQLMDSWHELQHHTLPYWNRLLHKAGFDARGIDTYGHLLAVAEILVGRRHMNDIGFDALNEEWTIDALKFATATELADQVEKWQAVIERLLSTTIDQWKVGEKLTVGKVLNMYERGAYSLEEARESLAAVGLGMRPSGKPAPGYCLAIPHSGPQLERIFEQTDYFKGGWINVLRQAPDDIVLRSVDAKYNSLRINNHVKKCLLVDMAAFHKATTPEGGIED